MNQSENRSSTNEDVQEESGWTTYLEDFSLMNNQRENYRSSCYSHEDDDHSFGHNSLLSDAASNAAWKNYCNTTNYNQVIGNECPTKKLNLKKLPRNKKINDPDLEDTASSPVNSPKGNEGSSRQFQEMQKVERGNVSLENNGYTDLKKKGLCLVPLSMFVNYQG